LGFVGDVVSGASFAAIFTQVTWPWAPTTRWNFVRFLLETKLESESFDPLIGFLAFLTGLWRWSQYNFGWLEPEPEIWVHIQQKKC